MVFSHVLKIYFYFRSSLVLVGINSGADGGQLCLFDIPQSKPIRCISLPFPVTSLALVSSVGK